MSSDNLPYLSKKSNGGAIIALESHGYYLDVKKDHMDWSFRIDDWNKPKRPKITPWKTVSDSNKLETSRLTKRIRDTLKEITGIYYEDSLNRILYLLEQHSYEWEIPEDAEKPEPERRQTVADQIVETMFSQGVQLFCDQFGNPHILIPTKNHPKSDGSNSKPLDSLHSEEDNLSNIYIEGELTDKENAVTPVTAVTINKIFSLSSQHVKRFISALIWETYEYAPKTDHIKSALLVLGGMAQANEQISLYNRVAEDSEGNWWLDLSNERWEAVKITDEGWSIEAPPILFKRYSHQIPLFTPTKDGTISYLLNYINLFDVNNQLLWLVTQISYIVPGIPHPQSVLWGEKGSIKSSAQLFIKMLLDNSSVELLSLPSKHKPNELIQQLSHHYLASYDNISKIDESQSDIFCRAISGIGQSKRLLYSDDQDFITSFQRCITQNGISITIGKPDLGDRSIVQETKKISKAYRRKMKEVKEEFISHAPTILSGFLDILVKARKIAKTLKVETLNRMADFTFWGACITQALGIDPKKFLIAYDENINQLEQETVRSSIIGEVLMDYLKTTFSRKDIKTINHTSTQLFRALLNHAESIGINIKDSDFPRGPAPFGKLLLNLIPNLPSLGYSARKKRTNKGSSFIFSKLKPTKLDDAIEFSEKNTTNIWKHNDLRDILSSI